MSDSHLQAEELGTSSLSDHEQKILDTALHESDQLLVRSLRDDQQRRQRRIWLSILLIGGVVMSLLLIAVLSGFFVVADASVAQSIEDTHRAEELTAEGWRLWGIRQYSQAATEFEKAVKLDPEIVNAWNGLGWSHFNGGKYEKAVAAFEQCIALQPKHAAALNGLGQTYLMWKDYPRAEKYFLKAAPTASAAWYGLARVYLLQEKFDKAKPWIDRLLKENPERADIKRMQQAVDAKKLDEELRRMIEPPGKPKQSESKSNPDTTRGWVMFHKGNVRTAERLFRRALEKDEKDLAAMNGLGFALLNQGKHEQAQPLFEKYLSIEKDAAGPLNGLAQCYKGNGKIDKAIEIWKKMEKKHPGPTAATTGLAFAYLEKNDFKNAQRYFQILADADPENKQYQNGLKRAQAGLSSGE